MGYCDEFLVEDNNSKHREFIRDFFAARSEIVEFVDKELGWEGTGCYDRRLKGTFNIGYVVKKKGPEVDAKHGEIKSAFIRFSLPGRTYEPWCEEKVMNEVMVLEYLRQHTTIPVPRVLSWGLAEDSPRKLAPFILMEAMDGVCLDDTMRRATEGMRKLFVPHDISELAGPDFDVLDKIYPQIADYMVQLSKLSFPGIGAISEDFGPWSVPGRPLTYDMNELVAETGFPAQMLSYGPFRSAREYFEQRIEEMWMHLCTQRNICETREEARQKFDSHHLLAWLIPDHCVDDGGGDGEPCFKLFNEDFGPFNMLVDPETLQITAVLDFEYTNAMPAQYLEDVPTWLLMEEPHCWLERDDLSGFDPMFRCLMMSFIREVQKAESKYPPLEPRHRLSVRMRKSWDTSRFWFNYAMRTSVDADIVVRKALDNKYFKEKVDEEEREKFVEMKMEQFEAYLKEKKQDPRFK